MTSNLAPCHADEQKNTEQCFSVCCVQGGSTEFCTN
jgi:hypothetical protein